jgi:transcriptional regulator with XRE-family HTH domain
MEQKKVEKEIGKRLKDLRLSKRLSQEKVGNLCNVSFQQIQKYEKGRNGLSAFRLLQLANGLGVSVSYFLEDIKPELQNFVGSQDVQQDQVVTPVVKTSYNDM